MKYCFYIQTYLGIIWGQNKIIRKQTLKNCGEDKDLERDGIEIALTYKC